MVGVYSQHAEPPSHLMPFDRPDLLSATHPSDHNAVRFVAQNERAHRITTLRYENLAKKKQKEREKAAKKEAKALSRGVDGRLGSEVNGVSYIQRRDQPAGAQNRSSASRYAHDATPFLVPVPIFFGGGLPIGVAACVAAGGLTASSAGGVSFSCQS